ncbi:TetR/AcrR family transcriptional regulator [Dictyobacter arantiisoli]|uniref:TetR family transcriptional regulator n=1 Tax=Dictyobacter arantiisoli TaxID=2014874 RepID=A0A5A5TEK9_9CHLR|nr:TetR/AcrR family transcriptional regulator [Dictyobacter arantiisoli]GCF09513.1 TetR family transcriptional regulator [Dictyobacter arantiisoli]
MGTQEDVPSTQAGGGEKAQDRRVKRTQQLLARALITLTLEKGYEAVTIREITRYADIGYATFFRHYPDKDALLGSVLDVVLNELLTLFSLPLVQSNAVEDGQRLFEYVQQHHEVIRVLLRSGQSASFVERIVATGTQSTLAKNEQLGNSVVPREIAANHIVTTAITLTQWWLEHGMPYPPQTMGKIYYELIIRPTHAYDATHYLPPI